MITWQDIPYERLGYKSAERYRARAESLFGALDLRDKRVLDVGCGRGTFSLWAAAQGAREVLGIEPEANGSTAGTLATFNQIIADLHLDQVRASDAFLADLSPDDGPFDVVVLYNVINHLDEDAVELLPDDDEARKRYVAHLEELKELLSPGATVIVADCGRTNYWNRVGLRSPLARTIEWQKHLDPPEWTDLFDQSGFRESRSSWSPLYPFGRLTTNRTVQLLTASHFVLHFEVLDESRSSAA